MDLNEYLELVNHIVFPYKLPDESTNKSFETNCLKLTNKILKEFSKTKCLFDPKFSCLIRLFERWITLQGNSIEIDSKKLREELKNLSVNDSLAIYMYRQNVCLLITMYDKEVIMSYFQTSVDNTQIMSNTTDIRANLPLDSIHVHCLDTLKSEQFSNLIADLASKPILETLSNSRKAHSDSKEIRDVAKTDLISNWLFSLLISNNSPRNQNNFPKRVNKKFRDEINLCKGAYIPFRRSGMWMSIKGIVEIQLCNLYPNKNEGLIYYKILMVLVLENLCSLSLEFSNLNDDLRLQMIKKLAKRIYKLSKITTISNDILTKCNNTINNVRELIENNHRDLLGSYNLNLDLNYDKINLSDTIHFEFKKIKKKFDKLIKSDLNTDNKKSLSKIKRNLISCDFPDISYLDCESDQLGIHLYDMENWILNHTFKNYEYYSKLYQLYNEYIFKGYKYYENDELEYSRMVLVCVKVICCLDQILCQKYPLLKEHNIGIELKLIEYLLVIKFEDLTIVYDELIEYIISRNSKAKYKSLIDSKIDENSFSVRYFNTNEDMQTIKNSIELEAERKKDLKINEYKTIKKEYNKLQSLFETLECECDDNILSSRFLLFSKSLKCQKCLIKKRMDEMFLTIFEWPLPLDINQAESVVFELRIPLDISQLRDSLFLIKSLTLKSIEHISSKICHETWREYDQLEKYSLNKSNYISLGSQTKSFLKTHYNSNHISRPIDEFLKNNGLSLNQVSLTTKELIKIDDNFFDHLQEKNTFKAVEPYSRLQYAINSTTHSENQILAELNHLPNNLTAKELVKFGFMRSGHQLQMRNLLDCLETRVLSLNDVSVTALLSQLLWQIGPIDYAYEREFKIPSSHFDLLNDEFISILSRIIKTYLDQINNKWNDCFTLYNLTNVTLRCFSVNKSHYLIDLLLECRKVAFKWIKDLRCFIEEQLPTNKAKYSKKLALISCFLILTYDVDKNQIDKILFESTHVLEWLEAMKIINTFKLSNDYKNDIFVVNLLKRIEICSLNIVEQYIKVITQNSESLTNFVKKHINFDTNSNWKCINVYPIWYLNESNNETIHINITGEILRNYFPISCLPINVTNDNIYKSFFKSFNLESTLNIKETSFSSKIQDISYEFFYDKNNELIIKEYFKNFESFFIESTQIEDYLPRLLIDNYSHWYNKTQNRIEFRSKYYSDEYSKSLNSQCEYVLDLNNLILSDSRNRKLINVQSNTFLEITTKFSNRLDSSKYVHIFKINSNELIINLPRLDLNFRLDKSDQSISSEEFCNFKVSNSQRIDTLIGLENYILLRENEAYPIRKLIIPHGTVITQNDSIKRKIKIRHDSSLEEECYFVYHIDNDLKRLKADDSNTAWLYLALLHATTSTLLEDEFLNMTGTEMALYLLQSAICWSIRPLSKASNNILQNLMCLSPKRLYYPFNLKVLQNVKWPINVPAYCVHDGFQFIAEKLIKDSLLLEFAFEKKEEINDELINTSSLILAQRAYFRAAKLYRPSQLITLLNWKQDEPKEFIEFKTKTIKETIDNIRLIQTQTNTIHGNEFDFLNDETNCFNWKKANELNLIDKNISCWIESNELTSGNIEQYFLDNWLELYKLAIRSYKSKEDEIKFKFILGYFAYKEIKLDYLILFKKLPHFRDFDYYEKDYNLEDGCKFNLAKLDNILTLNYINLQQYNERKPLYHMHKREYISNKINDIKLICEHLKKYAEDLEYKKDDEFYEANIVDFKMKLNGIHNKIKSLFESWKNNKELKIFLKYLKSYVNELVDNIDVKLNYFNKKQLILYKQSAELLFELKLNKYDKEFYSEAKLLFETGKMNSLNFKIKFNEIKKEEFPLELDKFEMNNLSQKYFKDLKESWNFYYSTNQIKVFANSENEFSKSIKFYSNKLKYYEKELKKFYTPSCRITNCLSRTGLWPCFSPLFYLRNLLSNTNDIEVNKVFNNIIGSFAVLMSLLKRTIRCVKYYYNKEKHGHLLEKELLNEPFSDWTPSDKPEWLILQLELNITIRKNQVNVAKAMLNSDQNLVFQLNMGEGKTAVIVPMLISSLTKQDCLVRLIVLRSLIDINYTALVYKIGLILNKRVYQLPFNREIKTDSETLAIYDKLLKECYNNKNVLLTLPEYCLSFKLKTQELTNSESNQIKKIQSWIEEKSRDILDESDEILATKYQLVYSIGKKSNLDGEKLRWIVSRDVLKLAKKNLETLKEKYKNQFEFQQDEINPQKFATIRLFECKPNVFKELRYLICCDFLNRNEIETNFCKLNSKEISFLKSFVLDFDLKNEQTEKLKEFKNLKIIILILRGLLTYDILLHVLQKRWKVEYGTNTKNNGFLQAVPYRAKDVPSERAQYGNPEVFILLTYLNYYYNGLEDSHLDNLFLMLENNPYGSDIYRGWINTLPSNLIDSSFKNFKSINLIDSKQKDHIYRKLKWHTTVIDYWLDNVLFPKEAKMFDQKLTASAWDLTSAKTNITTGFSDTNDTRFLLPLSIKFNNLPELIGTTGSVISSIVNLETNCYLNLKMNSNESDLLKELKSNNIKVLIDVGALMIKNSNENVIDEWLSIDKDSKAAVYFDKNKLMVKTRDLNKIKSFETSSYKQNLNKCLIYLDEFHTRGTDLNIPKTHLAGVTLGKGLTKDRLFQACMRMRLLGKGHSCKFIASFEVHELIKTYSYSKPQLKVLKWSIQNSISQISNEMLYWANQGISYLKKESSGEFTEECTNKLTQLYSNKRKELFIHEIIKNKTKCLNSDLVGLINEKLETLGVHIKKYDQMLDEEMEKEIEIECETEIEIQNEIEKPQVEFIKNILDEDVVNFIKKGQFNENSDSFKALTTSLNQSSIKDLIEIDAWSSRVKTTRDFVNTVKTYLFDDCFLRPPRWIAFNKLNNIFLILSAYEANELFKYFNKNVNLLMIIPRSRNDQLRLLTFSDFNNQEEFKWIFEQIFIFSGSLYFNNLEEQENFLQFISYFFKRNESDQKFIDDGLINKNGYVEIKNRKKIFKKIPQSLFKNDPNEFIIKLIDLRNYSSVPESAHHFDIFLKGKLPLK